MNEAPASKGTTVPLPAPFPPIPEPVGPTPAAGEAPVGYGVANETDVVATTLDCVSVDETVADGEASAVVSAVESVGEAGTAVATQSQTALAAPWTLRPVAGPQAERTQGRAAEAMAADWEELHWQA